MPRERDQGESLGARIGSAGQLLLVVESGLCVVGRSCQRRPSTSLGVALRCVGATLSLSKGRLRNGSQQPLVGEAREACRAPACAGSAPSVSRPVVSSHHASTIVASAVHYRSNGSALPKHSLCQVERLSRILCRKAMFVKGNLEGNDLRSKRSPPSDGSSMPGRFSDRVGIELALQSDHAATAHPLPASIDCRAPPAPPNRCPKHT